MAVKRRRKVENMQTMRPMRRNSPLREVWGFMIWLVGVLVSLAVGFGMTDGTLRIPFLSQMGGGIVVMAAGWIVVILAVLGVILKIIDKEGK